MWKNFSSGGDGKRLPPMSKPANAIRKMPASQQDQLLVQNCLRGDEEAWSRLIDKYKNLIFSIPIKRGFSPDEAADIFQAVCLALVSELPRLREPRALPAWLIQTTSHACFRSQENNRRYSGEAFEEGKLADGSPKIPEELVAELEREQIVRDAVSELSTDCRHLVEVLFYRIPSPTYDDLAAALEIPKGSIGPTRMRCLEKLRRLLEEKGF
jgi:RNA polymerase sigma factor (sigma-70 family)